MRIHKKRKNGEQKSQNRDISPPRGGTIFEPIFTKFEGFVDFTKLQNLITKYSMIFPDRQVAKRLFPF